MRNDRVSRRAWAVAAGLASVLIAACSSVPGPTGSAPGPTGSAPGPSSSAETVPIRIGALLSLTGAGADTGPGMEAAVKIAIDEINAAGGVLGRPLEVFFEDDALDPDQGLRATHKLIDVNQVSAILGLWTSVVTLAIAPVTIEKNMILMTNGGNPLISDLQDNNTVFRFNPPDALVADYVAREMYAQGFRRATVIANNESGPLALGKALAESFQKYGGTVPETVVYPNNQSDYSSEVQRVIATKPDLIFFAGNPPDATIILKKLYQLGSDTPIMAQASGVNQQVLDALGADAVKNVMAYDPSPATDESAYARLNKAYTSATGHDLIDNIYAAKAYDEVQLLAMAIQKAGSTNGTEVGAAIADLSNAPGPRVSGFAEALPILKNGLHVQYVGASGELNFDARGDATPYLGLYAVRNGTYVLQKTFH